MVNRELLIGDADIAVVTQKDCVACRATQRKATKLGLQMSLHDIEQFDEVSRNELVALAGAAHAPIVITHDDVWCGYNPSKLDALASKLAASSVTV